MPTFDLRGIRVAKYKNAEGVVSYEAPLPIGDAMSCTLELKFAEGRLYAESALAEYVKKATGGSISIGVKYLLSEAKKMMYGEKEKVRTVGSKQIAGTQTTALDTAAYCGVSFYAPDMIDGVEKYTCVFAAKAMFGPPGMSFATKGENITFQTPTTTGEFLPDDSADKVLMECAFCETAEEAEAWTKAVFGVATEG